MKRLTEGRKMFVSVMIIFIVYALTFILFEDYDRLHFPPFNEASDWHLLIFSLIVMAILSFLLHRYAKKMDERISREQAEKENQMRRELTQNIGHELKTPVASILGYTDTVIDNPHLSEEQKRQFLVRTNAQAKRLAHMLQDISTLNRIEFVPDMITMQKVDVQHIVSEIVSEISITMEKKRMKFNNFMPSSVFVTGNHALFYSLFRNLFDNSLNYAGDGSTISLTATEKGDYFHFVFSDNGQGVGEEHLPRLFERFYRVDKGRSRAIGGTGLGLAIVKNAVQLLGGIIYAEKNEERGIRFVFSIKK